MKPVQRIPYRVVAKPHPSQLLQTRKPLFAPKAPAGLKDTRTHPEILKQKQKYHHVNKDQSYYPVSKPDGIGLTEKELTKIKANKYYIKGNHQHSETTRPFKFLPTPPPHDNLQHFDQDKAIHKEKLSYSGLGHFGTYSPHTEYPQYHEHLNFQEEVNNDYHKQYVPVEEHIEDVTYKPKKEFYNNYQKQASQFVQNNKKTRPTVESIVDYINKWTANNHYDNSQYNKYKDMGDLDETNFEKAWLAGSEWVPIHAPAPAALNENRVHSYNNYDNTFSANTYSNVYSNPPQFSSSYTDQPQYSSQTFTNSLSPQSSTNSYSRHQSEPPENPYDIRSQIFHKSEVVMGKRPKSADVNNSHEVSAVFMVKQ